MDKPENSIVNKLTEGERVQMSVMLEKLESLHSQAELVKRAFSELITTIVSSRGLDPQQYGVNIGQGEILPLEERKL